jgi:hypothetical protein
MQIYQRGLLRQLVTYSFFAVQFSFNVVPGDSQILVAC